MAGLSADEQQQAAGQLRAVKSQSINQSVGRPLPDNYNQVAQPEKNSSQGSTEDTADPRNESLRARVLNRQKQQSKAAALKTKAKETVMAPAKQGTNWLLKMAWLNVIDSFGLTLIYINMHVFLRWVMPDLFCKMGEEWIPKQASVLGADEAMKSTGQAIGMVEVMGLLFLDLIAVFVIGSALAWVYILVDTWLHPVKALWNSGLNSIFNALWT